MEITRQNSPNECGICVINSFVKHFYNNSNKFEILNAANISENGLSIFDFENLGQKFGLFIESYECEWSEFVELKNNKYYGMLINKNQGMHYIIVYKKKDCLKIYDSDSGVFELQYNQFKEKFAGIIFDVSKLKVNIKYKSQKIDLQNIDLKYFAVTLGIHILIIGLSTLFANVFNWTLNMSVYGKSTSNLVSLCFIFLLIGGLNLLSSYFLKQYSLIRFKQNFRHLNYQLLNKLKHKRSHFINKIELSFIYIVDSSIVSICGYLTYEIPTLITDLIMCAITIIILSFIKPMFIVFCIVVLLIKSVFGVVTYNFKEHNINVSIKNSNISNNISAEIINSISKEENQELLNFNLDKLRSNITEFEKIYTKKTSFENFTFNFESFFTNVTYILTIGFGAYYLINNKFNIGLLTFIISLLGMFSTSVQDVCLFPSKQKEYKKMAAIYWNIINIANGMKDSSIKKIEDVNNLYFFNENTTYCIERNENIKSPFKIGLDTFLGINEPNKQNSFYFKDNFIKINPDSKIPAEYLLKTNIMVLKDLLSYFNINLMKTSFTIHEQQIINFMFTYIQSSKIICFNDCFRYLTKEQKEYIDKLIKEKVSKENFVFYIND